MPITNQYKRIPLEHVFVDRKIRQRNPGEVLDVSDLLPSIRARGVLSPIIVERVSPDNGEQVLLIAGERRLTASRELGLRDIPCRYVSDLSAVERKIIELEENIKRKDLPWKNEAASIKSIHDLYSSLEEGWTQEKTAEAIGITNQGWISVVLRVAEELEKNNKLVHEATGIRPAWNIIARREGRAVDDIMNELLEATPAIVAIPPKEIVIEGAKSTALYPATIVAVSPQPATESILCEDFFTWAPTYTGKPFSFIHCDFPYGINLDKSAQAMSSTHEGYADNEELYHKLCNCLADNIDRLMTQSGHLLFWLSSDIERQVQTLRHFAARVPLLEFRTVPIFWHKTDNRGILPDPERGPRQVVETALIASRGDRRIIRAVSNAYGSPTTKEVHQSEKPEPMLRHFLQMFVDENTRALDPTCGSGSSLRAAESLGASFVLGLEINPDFCEGARTALRKFRNLRALEKRHG